MWITWAKFHSVPILMPYGMEARYFKELACFRLYSSKSFCMNGPASGREVSGGVKSKYPAIQPPLSHLRQNYCSFNEENNKFYEHERSYHAADKFLIANTVRNGSGERIKRKFRFPLQS